MPIKYIQRAEIDKIKWNSCVHYATNSSVFGYMWYLDATAQEWDALVEDDYKTVMPLPYKPLRWGGKQLLQPELIRESAIYSTSPPSRKKIAAFWEALPADFRKGNLSVDAFSQPADQTLLQTTKTNYFLPLTKPYEEIQKGYSEELKEWLAKAEEAHLMPTASRKPEQIAETFRKHNSPVTENVFHGMQRVMYNLLHRGWGFAAGVMNQEQAVLASDFFIIANGRIMSFAASKTNDQLGDYAQAYMLDALIRNNEGKPQLLDFNVVSGDKSLAKMFGAIDYEYFPISWDHRKWGLF